MTFVERNWRAILVALALLMIVLQFRTIKLVEAAVERAEYAAITADRLSIQIERELPGSFAPSGNDAMAEPSR